MLVIIRKARFYKVDEFGVKNYHNSYLIGMAFAILYVIMFLFSGALLHFESAHVDANITTFYEAFWTLQMTASTIGYGDFHPVSTGGKIIATLMFYIGFGLVGFIVTKVLGSFIGFSNTDVRNRELRKQNAEIIERNKMLERKVDSLVKVLEKIS
ncbi:potassium channel family protein [Thalassotalea psychrophila]|uniref:Potassium channel family protein n=1 Tax=Thalassotalea psychrophila TaxID=3065647 RepID=A0ABY9TWF6_9GAMM|nr:potassium channel family protein [Colwelliaceae bacterium SQ149]